MGNLRNLLTNPMQLGDQVNALIAAGAPKAYASAGAITPKGLAVLHTGAASAMTLAPPAAAYDSLTILSADGEAYTVTAANNSINGADNTLTFGGAVGDSITLVGFGGKWIVNGTPSGVTLSEV